MGQSHASITYSACGESEGSADIHELTAAELVICFGPISITRAVFEAYSTPNKIYRTPNHAEPATKLNLHLDPK